MNGETPEEVTSFKNLGATLFKDGTRTDEVRIRIAMATASMATPSRLLTSSYITTPPSTGYTRSRSLHPTLRLPDLDPSRGQRWQDTGI
ncbi:hypothetical protein DPMN_035083 [Dreissena polymorpha]|uniref:Uncharacterized protein n=1 Tax=Dreissena polymorpha TaxID=45954 RepID=A0A9D4M810_DREPO|nr:hypothetical protein DPMN_035083 [Dreissena polymorpha]